MEDQHLLPGRRTDITCRDISSGTTWALDVSVADPQKGFPHSNAATVIGSAAATRESEKTTHYAAALRDRPDVKLFPLVIETFGCFGASFNNFLRQCSRRGASHVRDLSGATDSLPQLFESNFYKRISLIHQREQARTVCRRAQIRFTEGVNHVPSESAFSEMASVALLRPPPLACPSIAFPRAQGPASTRHVSLGRAVGTTRRSTRGGLRVRAEQGSGAGGTEQRGAEREKESRNELRLMSVAPMPVAALAAADALRELLEPYGELVRSWDLPDWLIHWGHPGNMAVVLLAMGGYGSYLGWQIRLASTPEAKEAARAAHPPIMAFMFLFFAIGATGGLTSLVTTGRPIFESPHAYSGMAGLVLLTIQTALTAFFKGNPDLRGVHGFLGIFIMHAAASALATMATTFPSAMQEEAFLKAVAVELAKLGFRKDNGIALVNTCRDEVCRPVVSIIDREFGLSFNISGLGGLVNCGKVGFKAAMSHSPEFPCDVDGNLKERYIFFAFPHVSIGESGEVGSLLRRGRGKPSSACGALIAINNDINNGVAPSMDSDDPEYTLLRKKIMAKVSGGNKSLVDVTRAALAAINEDLEKLISLTVDPATADYAVITGVQIHSGDQIPGQPFRIERTCDYIAPDKMYAVVRGQKYDLKVETPKSEGVAAMV
ncbi:unnamed protein product [Closterium sp. Yama58-4]|nr:unnamed protein product [Closterium sp. Yama58-4]